MRLGLRHGLARLGAALLLLALRGLAQAEEAPEVLAAGFTVPVMQATDSVAERLASTVPWYGHIQQAAQAYGVDAHLLQALVQVESEFNTHAVSRSGAIGLMQIMPATAIAVAGLRGTRQSLRQQLQDPAINVHAGALYMRSLMDTFSHRLDLALAAYNAGSGNVRKAGNRVPSNGETPQFVKKVTALYASIKAAALAKDAASPALAAPEAPAQNIPLPALSMQ
jgi:soluble lytic murein transglycosylase-like protein